MIDCSRHLKCIILMIIYYMKDETMKVNDFNDFRIIFFLRQNGQKNDNPKYFGVKMFEVIVFNQIRWSSTLNCYLKLLL